MKQLILMIVLTSGGVIGSLLYHPIVGLTVYNFYAVIRPQFLWQWVLPEGIAWSFYVLLGTALGVALHGWDRIYWCLTHTLIILFAVWICVSYFAAIRPSLGNLWMVDYGKYFFGYFLGVVIARRLEHLWILTISVGVGIAYIAYEINANYLINGFLTIQRSGFGGHDNNGAGLLLALGVPLCFFYYEGLRHWSRYLFLAVIPVIIHAVLMTYSRGAMLSLIAPTPLYLLRSRRKLMFVVIIGGLISILPLLAGKEIRERFFSIEKHDVDESAQTRFGSWRAGWQIGCDYPVTGSGVRNSPALSYLYGADMPGRVIHSQYIQILADNGFVGVSLYLAILASAWFGVHRVMWSTPRDGSREDRLTYYTAASIESALVCFCVGAVFLSLEAFEVQYILIFLAAQLHAVHAQRDSLNDEFVMNPQAFSGKTGKVSV